MVEINWNTPPAFTRQMHAYSDRMAGTNAVWNSDKPTKTQTESSQHINALNTVEKDNAGQAPSFSFGEFLDIVNPLQHIPVVNNIYRNFTGDDISSVAKIAGGAIYGGPIGGVTSLIKAATTEHSGHSLGGALREGFNNEAAKNYHAFDPEPRMAGA